MKTKVRAVAVLIFILTLIHLKIGDDLKLIFARTFLFNNILFNLIETNSYETDDADIMNKRGDRKL